MMLPSQLHNLAWAKLKNAADEYSEATGAEIAVISSYCDDNHINSKQVETYGHGHLHSTVKKNIKSIVNQDRKGLNSMIGNLNSSENDGIVLRNNTTSDSLSQSFRTLKLDIGSELMQSGGSSSYSHSTASTFSSPDDVSRRNKGSRKHVHSERRRRKPKNASSTLDFELDDELLFGENSMDDAEEDSSDLSDNSFGDDSYEDNHSRRYSTPRRQQPNLAASVPVNINLAWGHNSDVKFRSNQGPHAPFSGNTAATTRPKVITAEKTPQLDTMMASMQALARSVTDDSALIFGERPRPRLKNEGNNRLF